MENTNEIPHAESHFEISLHFGDEVLLDLNEPGLVSGFLSSTLDFQECLVHSLPKGVDTPHDVDFCRYVIYHKMDYQSFFDVESRTSRDLTQKLQVEAYAGGVSEFMHFNAETKRPNALFKQRNTAPQALTASFRRESAKNRQSLKFKIEKERYANLIELQRVSGDPIQFGDVIQLQHRLTGSFVTNLAAPGEAQSMSELKLLPYGSENAWFRLLPGYKSKFIGEEVKYGDTVTLQSFRHPTMHIQVNTGSKTNQAVQAASSIPESAIIGVPKVPTTLRVHSSHRSSRFTIIPFALNTAVSAIKESQPKEAKVLSEDQYARGARDTGAQEKHPAQSLLQGGNVVQICQVESGSYLTYREGQMNRVFFQDMGSQSQELAENGALGLHKDTNSYWKFESVSPSFAGKQLTWNQHYRIKHLATNKVLKYRRSEPFQLIRNAIAHGIFGDRSLMSRVMKQAITTHHLKVTDDYKNLASIWVLRPLQTWKEEKDPQGKSGGFMPGGLLYVENVLSGARLVLGRIIDQQELEKGAGAGAGAGIVPANHRLYLASTFARQLEMDALALYRVKEADVEPLWMVLHTKRSLLLFVNQIDKAKFESPVGEAPLEAWNQAIAGSQLGAVLAQHFSDGSILVVLERLILNLTPHSNNGNVLTRDGVPNERLQRAVREQGIIELLVRLLKVIFEEKGLPLKLIGDINPSTLMYLCQLVYRVLKQVSKENRTNQMMLAPHISMMQMHLGTEMKVINTLQEIYAGNKLLISQIQDKQLNQFLELLEEHRKPRFVKFLQVLALFDGEPIPLNQRRIINFLKHHKEILPIIDMDSDDNLVLVDDVDNTECQLSSFTRHMDKLLSTDTGLMSREEVLLCYYKQMLELYHCLCVGGNAEGIGFLLEVADLIGASYGRLLEIIKSKDLPCQIREPATRLFCALHVENTVMVQKSRVVRKSWLWADAVERFASYSQPAAEGEQHAQPGTALSVRNMNMRQPSSNLVMAMTTEVQEDRYGMVKDFILTYITKTVLRNVHEEGHMRLTLAILELLEYLLRNGHYTKSVEGKTKPLRRMQEKEKEKTTPVGRMQSRDDSFVGEESNEVLEAVIEESIEAFPGGVEEKVPDDNVKALAGLEDEEKEEGEDVENEEGRTWRSVKAEHDLVDLQSLSGPLLQLIDGHNSKAESNSDEGQLLMRCQVQVCTLLAAMYEVRLDKRACIVLGRFETFFRAKYAEPLAALQNNPALSTGFAKARSRGLCSRDELEVLCGDLFSKVQFPLMELKQTEPLGRPSRFVSILIQLMTSQHLPLVKAAFDLLYHHFMQSAALMTHLDEMQLLAVPALCTDYLQVQREVFGINSHLQRLFDYACKAAITKAEGSSAPIVENSDAPDHKQRVSLRSISMSNSRYGRSERNIRRGSTERHASRAAAARKNSIVACQRSLLSWLAKLSASDEADTDPPTASSAGRPVELDMLWVSVLSLLSSPAEARRAALRRKVALQTILRNSGVMELAFHVLKLTQLLEMIPAQEVVLFHPLLNVCHRLLAACCILPHHSANQQLLWNQLPALMESAVVPGLEAAQTIAAALFHNPNLGEIVDAALIQRFMDLVLYHGQQAQFLCPLLAIVSTGEMTHVPMRELVLGMLLKNTASVSLLWDSPSGFAERAELMASYEQLDPPGLAKSMLLYHVHYVMLLAACVKDVSVGARQPLRSTFTLPQVIDHILNCAREPTPCHAPYALSSMFVPGDRQPYVAMGPVRGDIAVATQALVKAPFVRLLTSLYFSTDDASRSLQESQEMRIWEAFPPPGSSQEPQTQDTSILLTDLDDRWIPKFSELGDDVPLPGGIGAPHQEGSQKGGVEEPSMEARQAREGRAPSRMESRMESQMESQMESRGDLDVFELGPTSLMDDFAADIESSAFVHRELRTYVFGCVLPCLDTYLGNVHDVIYSEANLAGIRRTTPEDVARALAKLQCAIVEEMRRSAGEVLFGVPGMPADKALDIVRALLKALGNEEEEVDELEQRSTPALSHRNADDDSWSDEAEQLSSFRANKWRETEKGWDSAEIELHEAWAQLKGRMLETLELGSTSKVIWNLSRLLANRQAAGPRRRHIRADAAGLGEERPKSILGRLQRLLMLGDKQGGHGSQMHSDSEEEGDNDKGCDGSEESDPAFAEETNTLGSIVRLLQHDCSKEMTVAALEVLRYGVYAEEPALISGSAHAPLVVEEHTRLNLQRIDVAHAPVKLALSERMRRRLLWWVQLRYVCQGVGSLALRHTSITSQKVPAEAARRLLLSLVEGDNPEALTLIHQQLTQGDDDSKQVTQSFFASINTILQEMLDAMPTFFHVVVISHQPRVSGIRHVRVGAPDLKESSAGSSGGQREDGRLLVRRVKDACELLRLLQLLGRHSQPGMQALMRSQPHCLQTYDIVSLCIKLVETLQPLLAHSLDEGVNHLPLLMVSCLATLRQFVRGPCPENQALVCHSPLLKSLDQMLTSLSLKEYVSGWEAHREHAVVKFAKGQYRGVFTPDLWGMDLTPPTMCCCLHYAALDLIGSLMEGGSAEHAATIRQKLQLSKMHTNMYYLHKLVTRAQASRGRVRGAAAGIGLRSEQLHQLGVEGVMRLLYTDCVQHLLVFKMLAQYGHQDFRALMRPMARPQHPAHDFYRCRPPPLCPARSLTRTRAVSVEPADLMG
ncbi:hypothetical protein CYMTET_50243 [Cymbomonas tetramitiformis]|uniref:MIR domain-containing protein n=1 Tax=Cymbomonas tetramitiformis TaxID=36881 RepID=A0AAE0ET13_9CHLO|nr:hypothetical protein CYMTET_50243 [Cymbomonas tetramitiformis]